MAHEPVKFRVEIDDQTQAWSEKKRLALSAAIQLMATDTLKSALVTAPKAKTNHLRTSGFVEVKDGGLTAKVSFGSGRVKYAAYQERGHRWDGSHQVRNYTTPGTGAHYLKNAGDAAVEKGIKWYLSHS